MCNKTQKRAICPICFNEQAVKGGRMVAHGYTRPYGYYENVGNCLGVSAMHFGTEAGRDHAAYCAKLTREDAARFRREAQLILKGEGVVRDYKGRIITEPTERDRAAAADRCQGHARAADGYAKDLEQRVENWREREPRTVEVEPKQTLVHLRLPKWGKACGASRMGARKGVTTPDESAVTCPKCAKIIERRKANESKA